MDTIVNMWKEFSISEEEKVLGVDDNSLAKGNRMLPFELVGRVMTKKPVHKSAFQEAIGNLWKVDGGFESRSLGKDTFIFSFKLQAERKRILSREPWHFSKAVVILKRLEDCSGVDWGGFKSVGIWVQIHGLSFRSMSEEVGMMLGNHIGTAISVDKDATGRCFDSFLRVRVIIDITRPLLRGSKIRLGSQAEASWVEFRYERLPEFYFGCGRRGHGVKDCILASSTEMPGTNQLPYGG